LKNFSFIIFSLDSNKIFPDYTERRKAMNRKEDKYKVGNREEYLPKGESMRKENKEEITKKKQIRMEER